MRDLTVPVLAFGAGAAVGVWLYRLRRRRLPRASRCPRGGAFGSGQHTHEDDVWVFFGNHFANEGFYNKIMAQDDPENEFHIAYPARLRARAGFMRAWGLQSKRRLGDQTTTYVTRLPAGDARAHDLVGVIVPFDALARLRPELRRGLVAVPFGGETFDWLGWTDPPAALREVHVAVMKVERMAPP